MVTLTRIAPSASSGKANALTSTAGACSNTAGVLPAAAPSASSWSLSRRSEWEEMQEAGRRWASRGWREVKRAMRSEAAAISERAAMFDIARNRCTSPAVPTRAWEQQHISTAQVESWRAGQAGET
eukprot:3185111-Rhodomonas_salina.1